MVTANRGGARNGAGRKAIGDSLTRRVNVSINDDVADLYRQAGDGVLSEGLRRASRLLDDETIRKLQSK